VVTHAWAHIDRSRKRPYRFRDDDLVDNAPRRLRLVHEVTDRYLSCDVSADVDLASLIRDAASPLVSFNDTSHLHCVGGNFAV
jgi:hypothetical protein